MHFYETVYFNRKIEKIFYIYILAFDISVEIFIRALVNNIEDKQFILMGVLCIHKHVISYILNILESFWKRIWSKDSIRQSFNKNKNESLDDNYPCITNNKQNGDLQHEYYWDPNIHVFI